MNVFLAVFGTIMGCFILITGMTLVGLGFIPSLVLSLGGFFGPIFAYLNRKLFIK